MKKNGVLTLHYQTNYGGVLQTFATQKALEKLNVDYEFIDYRFKCHHTLSIEQERENFFDVIKDFIFGFRSQHKKRRCVTKKFIRENIRLSKRVYNSYKDLMELDGYENIMIGSDQVFNPFFFSPYNPYLLKGLFIGKKSSYSSSFGIHEFPNEFIPEYTEALNEFSSISVREESGKEIINKILGKKVEVTLDPTLLLTEDEWLNALNIVKTTEDGSVFCYWLGDISHLLSVVKDVVFKRKKKIKIFMFWPEKIRGRKLLIRLFFIKMFFLLHPNVRVFFGAGPREFINELVRSSYVLGTSFHSLMFATIFHKKTKIFINTTTSDTKRATRITDFCKKHNIMEVLSTDCLCFHKTRNCMDFYKIDVDLSNEVAKSYKYLGEILK